MFANLILFLAIARAAHGTLSPRPSHASFSDICDLISSSISPKSNVYYPGTTQYKNDIYHWSTSSSQPSACVVEPATVQDVGEILQILGQTRTPFGVKSGGHTGNPGFSSTPGVLIVMSRFNTVQYDPVSQTAIISTGLVFDDVYAALSPYNVSVVGGRESGVGVGGFMLGGGYSWRTGQHGLAIDTVTAFELVKPNGQVIMVTEESDSELFFGLKGIVTSITMQTFPQTSVWGGSLVYPSFSASDVTAAVIKFSATNTDPKASMAASYGCILGVPIITVLLYYDAPSPPQGLFDGFLKIPIRSSDIRERSLYDYVKSTPVNITANVRGVFQTVPILEYSEDVMKTIQKENKVQCINELAVTGTFVLYIVEPILPNILSHSRLPSAYPPTRDKAFSPFNIHFGWLLEIADKQATNNIKKSAARIRQAVIADGQDITAAPMYPNYALFDTPLEQMYGSNVNRLKALRRRVDPLNVMGLAGGFRF